MKAPTLIIFLLLLTAVSARADGVEQISSSIVNYSHFPLAPMDGEDLTVTASISVLPPDFNNLTLVYSVDNGGSVRVVMDSLGGTQYSGVIPGQTDGSIIRYYIELYYGDALQDRKPTDYEVVVEVGVQGPVHVIVNPGVPQGLPKGNYSLSDSDGSIFLNISITASIELNLTLTDRDIAPEIPGNTLISDLFSIEVNDSDAISTAEILIPYDEMVLDDLGVIETGLVLLTRETPTSDWEVYPSTLFLDENIVVANVSHFSEWAVGTKSAALRILDMEYDEKVDLATSEQIEVTVSNIGNTLAENVSTRVFLPDGLLLTNESDTLTTSELRPLQNLTVSWSFFADKGGFYTIVVVSDGVNTDEEIVEIVIEVGEGISEDPAGVSSSSEGSNTNSVDVSFVVPPISLVLLDIILRKGRKTNNKRNC